jgi:hypothetical protein
VTKGERSVSHGYSRALAGSQTVVYDTIEQALGMEVKPLAVEPLAPPFHDEDTDGEA